MLTNINRIIQGDCLDVMKTFPDNCIDSIVSDPPYGLKFMSKEWDHGVPGIPFWQEALRVAKPGAHLLAFGGTRTHHRLMCAIEDAGWEHRDVCMWLYGSGYPKSLNIGKAIDKQFGAEREVIGRDMNAYRPNAVQAHKEGQVAALGLKPEGSGLITAPATNEAKQWDGYGSGLKPAWEPIILARKPVEGTIAQNVLKWGCGGLNIDGCRVELNGDYKSKPNGRPSQTGLCDNYNPEMANIPDTKGRFPANLILDEDAGKLLNAQTGILKSGDNCTRTKTGSFLEHGGLGKEGDVQVTYGDEGGAARFFYCAKVKQSERDAGLEDFTSDDERKTPMAGRGQPGLKCKLCGHWKNSGSPCKCENPEWEQSMFVSPINKNTHPTVKPLALMRYLCRLITPPRGIVLDPFCGSGSTCIAAMQERFNYIGIDKESEYVEIANKRIVYWKRKVA